MVRNLSGVPKRSLRAKRGRVNMFAPLEGNARVLAEGGNVSDITEHGRQLRTEFPVRIGKQLWHEPQFVDEVRCHARQVFLDPAAIHERHVAMTGALGTDGGAGLVHGPDIIPANRGQGVVHRVGVDEDGEGNPRSRKRGMASVRMDR